MNVKVNSIKVIQYTYISYIQFSQILKLKCPKSKSRSSMNGISSYQTQKCDTGCPTKHDSFECLLPYTVLDIKDFSQFNSLKNLLLNYILLLNKVIYNMTAIWYFFLFSLVSNSLIKYGRRHFILFTNYHVSLDTLSKKKRLLPQLSWEPGNLWVSGYV